MAIAQIFVKGGQRRIYGDDEDRLSGLYDDAGTKFYSMDTDIAYLYDGNGWLPFNTDGAFHVLDKTAITFETDAVAVLNEISRKLSVLIKYESMLHKINLEDEINGV